MNPPGRQREGVTRSWTALSTVALMGSLATLSACEEPPTPGGTRVRSDAVSGAPVSAQPPSHPSGPSLNQARKPRAVCTTRPGADGESLAEVELGHVEADGEAPLGSELTTGDGKWTWINLWAGWCGPCKEEMPLLLEFARRESATFRLAFVSVDDDPRLSKRFLATQPAGGVRRSQLLAEGPDRKKWLASAGLAEIAKLPIHVLVDPGGKVRCVIQGAVEEPDLAGVTAFMKKPRP